MGRLVYLFILGLLALAVGTPTLAAPGKGGSQGKDKIRPPATRTEHGKSKAEGKEKDKQKLKSACHERILALKHAFREAENQRRKEFHERTKGLSPEERNRLHQEFIQQERLRAEQHRAELVALRRECRTE